MIAPLLIPSTFAFTTTSSTSRLLGHRSILHHPGEKDGDIGGNDVGGDGNDEMLDELRGKKKDLFGADIPSTDELKDAARDAEDAFLAAMLEQTKQFRRIKTEEGSEKAVDVFMEKIQRGDERSRLEDEKSMEALMEGEDEEGGTDDEVGSDPWQ